VLIAVMFLAALVGVLSLGMLSVMTTETAEVWNHRESLRALAIAEAGVEHACQLLRADAEWDAGLHQVSFPVGSASVYSVAIDTSEYPEVVLTATGLAGDFERRVVARVLVYGPPREAPFAVRVMSWREP
jgi:hypothetical protein